MSEPDRPDSWSHNGRGAVVTDAARSIGRSAFSRTTTESHTLKQGKQS